MKAILIADDKANIRNLFRRVTVTLEQIMVNFVRTSAGQDGQVVYSYLIK